MNQWQTAGDLPDLTLFECMLEVGKEIIENLPPIVSQVTNCTPPTTDRDVITQSPFQTLQVHRWKPMFFTSMLCWHLDHGHQPWPCSKWKP